MARVIFALCLTILCLPCEAETCSTAAWPWRLRLLGRDSHRGLYVLQRRSASDQHQSALRNHVLPIRVLHRGCERGAVLWRRQGAAARVLLLGVHQP